MKKTIAITLILGLMALIPSSSSFAQEGKGMKNAPMRKMMKELNLSQDQKDQISKFRTDNQKKNIDLKAEIEKTRIQIKEELNQKNPDEGKIIDLSKKVSSIQADMKAGAISTWFKTYKILDDKQKEVFKKATPMFLEKGREMMKGRMKGRGRMM